jgi:predicted nucleic acid-binding protein
LILVDSSVWIDYFNGKISFQTDFLDSIVGKDLIIIGDIVYIEVLQGFRNDNDFNSARELLELFPLVNLLDREVAIKSITMFRELRKKGVTIRKTIDTIIASYCIINNITLLQSDRDFIPFRDYMGLQVIEE